MGHTQCDAGALEAGSSEKQKAARSSSATPGQTVPVAGVQRNALPTASAAHPNKLRATTQRVHLVATHPSAHPPTHLLDGGLEQHDVAQQAQRRDQRPRAQRHLRTARSTHTRRGPRRDRHRHHRRHNLPGQHARLPGAAVQRLRARQHGGGQHAAQHGRRGRGAGDGAQRAVRNHNGCQNDDVQRCQRHVHAAACVGLELLVPLLEAGLLESRHAERQEATEGVPGWQRHGVRRARLLRLGLRLGGPLGRVLVAGRLGSDAVRDHRGACSLGCVTAYAAGRSGSVRQQEQVRSSATT